MLKLSSRVYQMPLQHPFTISRYTVTVQTTVIATITDGVFYGYGEATANPYYHSSAQKITASLQRIAPLVSNVQDLHPEEFWDLIEPHLREDYFALCAADVAYWDYYAKRHQKPLRRFFSASDDAPLTSYTIGLDSVAQMKLKMEQMPWPIYKIKLGTRQDLEIVSQLRRGSNSVFRVDANAAWTPTQAITLSHELAKLGVEFIEQPLPADDIGMKRVKELSALPVMADESCQKAADVQACAGLFDIVNIKLMKCGGITPALGMIKMAKSLGMRVMAGCMTESSVGISALCQLAPLLDYLDADGALLLAGEPASGVTFHYGKIQWVEAPGTGAFLLSDPSTKC